MHVPAPQTASVFFEVSLQIHMQSRLLLKCLCFKSSPSILIRKAMAPPYYRLGSISLTGVILSWFREPIYSKTSSTGRLRGAVKSSDLLVNCMLHLMVGERSWSGLRVVVFEFHVGDSSVSSRRRWSEHCMWRPPECRNLEEGLSFTV